MSRFGLVAIFLVVLALHIFALQSHIKQQKIISKPKAKVHHITLSSVAIQKPKPVAPTPKVKKHIVEPIILPPEPIKKQKPKKHLVEPIILPAEPITKPQPKKIVEPKPRPKKRHKKRVKKYKRSPKPEPIIEEEIQEITSEPIIEQAVAPIKRVDTTSIKDRYTSQIRRAIKSNLFYPKVAKRMRIEGVVKIAFRVSRSGAISGVRVLNSPKSILIKGAKKTIGMISLPPFPDELREQFMDISIPIEFKLRRR